MSANLDVLSIKKANLRVNKIDKPIDVIDIIPFLKNKNKKCIDYRQKSTVTFGCLDGPVAADFNCCGVVRILSWELRVNQNNVVITTKKRRFLTFVVRLDFYLDVLPNDLGASITVLRLNGGLLEPGDPGVVEGYSFFFCKLRVKNELIVVYAGATVGEVFGQLVYPQINEIPVKYVDRF